MHKTLACLGLIWHFTNWGHTWTRQCHLWTKLMNALSQENKFCNPDIMKQQIVTTILMAVNKNVKAGIKYWCEGNSQNNAIKLIKKPDAHRQLSAESRSSLLRLRSRQSASLRAPYWQLWRWMAAGSYHWLPVVSLKPELSQSLCDMEMCNSTH